MLLKEACKTWYNRGELSFILFADDTNLLMSHKDPDTLMIQMNRELELISTWLALNKLSLNLAKTHFILLKSSRKKIRSELTLKIKDQIISQVEYTKFLGVIIDSNLSWKQHINSVANKISKLTGILCKARHFVTRPLLKSIYYALICPYIFCGNVVRANTYQSKLDKIYKLQKKIVRIMSFKEYNHSSKPLFKELNILNVYQVNYFVTGNVMYQYSKNQLPPAIMSQFKTNEEIHNYNTRSSKKLHKPKSKTNVRKFTICDKGVDIYNSLPCNLKGNQYTFKQKLKKFVLESQY